MVCDECISTSDLERWYVLGFSQRLRCVPRDQQSVVSQAMIAGIKVPQGLANLPYCYASGLLLGPALQNLVRAVSFRFACFASESHHGVDIDMQIHHEELIC